MGGVAVGGIGVNVGMGVRDGRTVVAKGVDVGMVGVAVEVGVCVTEERADLVGTLAVTVGVALA
jgi:hypothetical protein